MTELAPLHHTHAEFQLAQTPITAHYAPASHPTTNGYTPPAHQHTIDEDSSVIRCFCGLSDDDGNTVLCEICNTWQHILCYYPGGNETVPDEHFCVICRPRTYDKRGALERQQNARVLVSPQDRKIKKAPSKTHKKKVKDVNSTSVQTNGWLSGTEGPDRASGSPRDGAPPAKRPKTTHRSSASTSMLPSGPSRKRAGSTTLNGQSPTKSPRSNSPEGYTGDYYSPEFMHKSNAPFLTVQDNTYASINVSNDLRTWLNDVGALAEVAPGHSQKDVFTRWDRPIEALRQMSPGVSSCKREDPTMMIHGVRPVHRWVEASTSCDKDSYIGELNGLIGRIEDYKEDLNNRWNELRHPEPYVFFHDKLPIFVDCRDEGSVLRHVGRSCHPNVKLQIIIHGTDFHFCFVSLREIAAGEELTVPWHLRDREYDLVSSINGSGNPRPEDVEHMSMYFTNVLANFGGCACSRLDAGVVCNLTRFDLRNKDQPYATNSAVKAAKPRKPKRLPTQISPGSTGRATNSRAGSEAVAQGDNDEEMADSRSLSARSRSQPSSRDITPLLDAPIGLGLGMSDRERRKIQQQEKLFEKMEADGGRKGKRHSAGSALNTPGPSSVVRRSKLLLALNADMKQKQLNFPTDQPSPIATNATFPRPRANGLIPKPSNGTKAPRLKPRMVSMPTQTDGDVTMASPSPPRRRNTGSHVSCLLRRVQQESRRRKERSASIASIETKPSSEPTAMVDAATKMETTPSPILTSMPPPPIPISIAPRPDAFGAAIMPDAKDVDMHDAPYIDERASALPTTDVETHSISTITGTQPPEPAPLEAQIEPPPPPWTSDKPPTPPSIDSPTFAKSTQVPLPSIPSFNTSDSVSSQAPLTTPSLVESPAPLSVVPTLSPNMSHASITAPSPAKKKLSLGDWMRQKKEKEAVAKQALQNEHEPRSDSISEEEAKRDAEVAMEDEDMPLVPLPEEVVVTSSPPATPEAVAPLTVTKAEPQEEVKHEEGEVAEHKTDDILDPPFTTASSS